MKSFQNSFFMTFTTLMCDHKRFDNAPTDQCTKDTRNKREITNEIIFNVNIVIIN